MKNGNSVCFMDDEVNDGEMWRKSSVNRDLLFRHRGLVTKYVEQYSRYGVPREQLRQRGNIELMEAARKFNPHRGFSFERFASWMIKKGMMEGVIA